jgi:RNA polymerase-binding transcription factor DksA
MNKNDSKKSEKDVKEDLHQKGLSLLDETQEDFATEVFDEADIANAIEMNNIHAAIQRNKEKLAKEFHPDFDGESCIDCGETIHKVRLELGKIRCFDCQTELEKRSKMFR